MDQSLIKVLILEDDETLGEALKEALVRSGHHAIHTKHPDQALTQLHGSQFDFVFVDCLLPQMTGVDFVQRAQNQAHGSPKYILMSGIYTDKNFVKEALQKTKAIAFLQKPFDLEEALRYIPKKNSAEEGGGASSGRRDENNARKLLYQMFANSAVTSRQKRKVIEQLEEVSGFDLPFIYSLLVETKSSGHLTIYSDDGAVSGVSIANGNIVTVDVEDKNTFLGEMLIQSGYADPQDIQAALRDKKDRKIGNYLIQNNQLSPHAFDLILAEQMNLRLSRTIVDKNIRINFSPAEVELSNPYIDADSLLVFLHDWIASKIQFAWLRSHYMMWQGHLITKTSLFRPDHSALAMKLITSLDGFATELDKRVTINQLLDSKNYNEGALLKAIHFLLTKGLIVFAAKSTSMSDREQLSILKKIWADIKDKNQLQTFEYIHSMPFNADEDPLTEFRRVIGERPKDISGEPGQLWLKILDQVEQALTKTIDEKTRIEFKANAERGEAEAKLKAASLLEEVKQSLQLNQYPKALATLRQIEDLKIEVQQFHLYNAWTRLSQLDSAKKQVQLKEIEMELMQVPPDERYDALYPFVMGLFYKAKGDYVSARKSLEKSIALDSSFIVARREMSVIEGLMRKKPDLLTMDLKDVVSGFFKKR